MSRHRQVRNINIEDELDDEALSDGGEEDMTDEHHARLLYGLEHVREVLGDERTSGLSDKEIKDALWHYFFDEGKTVQWAIEEQQKRQRKGPNLSKDLPPVPQEEENGSSNSEYYHPEQSQRQDSMERPRGPLVFQHQQPESLDFSDMGGPKMRLSTITERTERTEVTPRYATGHILMPHAPRVPSSSFTASSYGQVVEQNHTYVRGVQGAGDPDHIPVSPSTSALKELSTFVADSEVQSAHTATPRTVSEAVLPSDDLPEIPDYNSKSAGQPPTPTSPAKKSKLSLLASSRLASTRSESSRSSGVALKGSVKTFPSLRPSAESAAPASRIARSRSPSLQSSSHLPNANEEYYNPPSSSTSSHIRRAIQTAMDLEREDKVTQPAVTMHSHPTPSTQQPSVKVDTTTLSQHQPQSKDPDPSSSQAPIARPTQPYQEVDTFRPQSKLALLAQKKALQNNRDKAPKPVTEYLTPIGNGPTVTTAITTSYQNFYTLTDPSRSRVIPAQHVVPLGMTPPSESKPSKLAAKIKKAHQKQSHPSAPDQEPAASPVPPMFVPGALAHVRASPSAFASLLIDNSLISTEDKVDDQTPHQEERKQNSESGSAHPISSSRGRKHKVRKSRQERPLVPSLIPSMGFQFDAPSPDDIVANARRGTSLASSNNKLSSSATRKAMSATLPK